MSVFHNLKVTGVIRLHDKAVQVDFEVPKKLQKLYSFEAGQYITIKQQVGAEEVRRSYSICIAPEAKTGLFKKAKAHELSIGIKEVEGGKLSTYLNQELKEGDFLSVMEPAGKFTLPAKDLGNRHFVMVAAGSGITPILSQIETILGGEDHSTIVLCYGNRNEDQVMFSDRLNYLANKFPTRLFIYNFFSQAKDLTKKDDKIDGRLKASLIYKIGEKHKTFEAAHYYLCGPSELINDLQTYLPMREVAKENIHVEYFTQVLPEKSKKKQKSSGEVFNTTIVFEGLEHSLEIPAGKKILEAVLDAGIDAPYSCQSGVCCTCQAKGEFGDFDASDCLSLSDEEIRDGQVLTCVGKIVRDNTVINYDL